MPEQIEEESQKFLTLKQLQVFAFLHWKTDFSLVDGLQKYFDFFLEEKNDIELLGLKFLLNLISGKCNIHILW